MQQPTLHSVPRAAGVLLLLLAAACTTPEPAKPSAVAVLKPTNGHQAAGSVWFTQENEHVAVRVSVSGLAPNREHGFHVHEKGDCSSPDASSAGGHFNPSAKPHGPPGAEHHAGDLPALKADANGNAEISFEVKGLLIGSGATDLMGKALVVHADPDDYTTQPTGNSGARVACGVIATPAAPKGLGEPASTIPKQM